MHHMSHHPSRHSRRRPPSAMQNLASGLGWFSVGLGLVELAAPGTVARTLGMRGSERMIRACGLREIATGAAILASSRPAPFVWARVAGDALDIATLGVGMRHNRKAGNVRAALAAVAGVTMLDVLCAQGLAREERTRARRRRLSGRYSRRTGFPEPAEAMRGAASDFVMPEDFRVPEALRPWSRTRRRRSEPSEDESGLMPKGLPGLA
jgi:hypothetical protein